MDKSKESNYAEPFVNDKNKQTTPTTTDDESIITTSTASDTFESWTLVTDKQKDNNKLNNNQNTTNENRIEDLSEELETSRTTGATVDNDDEEVEQADEPLPKYDAATGTTSATDEFSDEVSIISESDSGELLSAERTNPTTNPFQKDHLQKLNLKFTTGIGLDLPTLLQQQQMEEQSLQQKREVTPPRVLATTLSTNHSFRQRKKRSLSNEQQKYQKSLTATASSLPATRSNTKIGPYVMESPFELFGKCLFNGFVSAVAFFVCIGMLGRMYLYSTYLDSEKTREPETIESLGEKVYRLQSENSLLQAELSFLDKQMNYLKTLYHGKAAPEMEPKRTDFNRLKAKDYNQDERLEAWKNRFERQPPVENNNEVPVHTATEPIEELRNDPLWEYLEPSDTVSESNNSEVQPEPEISNDKPLEQPKQQQQNQDFQERRNSKEFKDPTTDEQQQRKIRKQNNSKERFAKDNKNFDKQRFPKRDNSKERFDKHNTNKNHEASKERFHRKVEKDNSNERRQDSKERFNRKDERGNSKERRNPKNGNNNNYNNNKFDNSKEHKRDNTNERQHPTNNMKYDDSNERQYKNKNSKQRDIKDNRSDNSKERRRNNSKERKQKKQKSDDTDEEHSGDWMEKLMQQREEARRQQEQRLDAEKNWYLNRQDSREQWRNVDSRR